MVEHCWYHETILFALKRNGSTEPWLLKGVLLYLVDIADRFCKKTLEGSWRKTSTCEQPAQHLKLHFQQQFATQKVMIDCPLRGKWPLNKYVISIPVTCIPMALAQYMQHYNAQQSTATWIKPTSCLTCQKFPNNVEIDITPPPDDILSDLKLEQVQNMQAQ